MPAELEIKLLEIDVDEITNKLVVLGANSIFEGYLRNTIFFCAQESDLEYIRIRDDGKITTLTYKKIQPETIVTIEHEIIVSSYQDAIKLMKLLGLKHKRTDEKFRRRYKLENTFIDIDTWPNIPSYIEIEAKTERDIKNSCSKLGLRFENRFKGDTLDVFRHYGYDPSQVTEMTFPQNKNG